MTIFKRILLFLIAAWMTGCHSWLAEERPDPVLLISIDGFKPAYLDRMETPHLDQLAASGVMAEALIPVFPTKTFPTHYSMVTGLYPEQTGVISNTMADPDLEERFRLSNQAAITDGRWYGGEPIWVTAEKQGRRSATLFWPGSEAEINGIRPDRWMPYDGGLSYTARVDSVVAWLDEPDESRPDLLTLYFHSVDSRAHRYGTDSDEVRQAVEDVDSQIGYLIHRLQEIGRWPDINLLITSDHGMVDLSEERVVFLDDIIDLKSVDVIDWTPVAMIQPKEGMADEVYQQLKAAEMHYQVYRKAEIPERFRLRNHQRTPEIVVLADLGYTLTSHSYYSWRGIMGAAHGYDNRHPEMHGIFLATGPAFRSGYQFGRLESIHLYALMCRLLRVEPAPNEGSFEAVQPLLQ
ncbi:MAG: ectonucleotide pyrophosphatase/phosphodiesterase [Balneolaceae bacterium]